MVTHNPAEALREALEPFATFAEGNVDEHGWTGIAVKNDRIVCWFGPSDFRRAAEAFAAFTSPAAGEVRETCKTCQGNGEIVTDWERYLHAHPGDKGDEAVAECADCDGKGTVTPPPSPDVAGVVERLRERASKFEETGYEAAFIDIKELRTVATLLGRLVEALKPFGSGPLPSSKKTEIAFDRHGLRRSMSPLEIARLNAERALTPKEKTS